MIQPIRLVISVTLDLVGIALDVLIDTLETVRLRSDRANYAVWGRYLAHDERTKP